MPQPSSAVVSAAVVGQMLRDREFPPHAAFVLTWSKVKERQISTGRVFQSTKRLCHKWFRASALPALCGFLQKSGGNRRMCQGEKCAHLNDQ